VVQLLLDTYKPVEDAVAAWRQADVEDFTAPADPFAALAKRFGAGG
jgi:hypothetical protein